MLKWVRGCCSRAFRAGRDPVEEQDVARGHWSAKKALARWRLALTRMAVLHVLAFAAGCAREPIPVMVPTPTPYRLIVLEGRPGDAPLFTGYLVDGQRLYPIPEPEGFVQIGMASWYGGDFHGRRTSSGEVFDTYRQRTAAHNTLPMGTYVEITHLEAGKKTIVRVNDRGPFVKSRIVDLSHAAAKEIDMIGPGTAKVRLVALGREVDRVKTATGYRPIVEVRDFNGGAFSVQVGAFREEGNALGLARRLKGLFDHVDVSAASDEAGGRVYRVRVSKSKTLTQAGEVERKLRELGFEEAFIVSL